VQSIQEATISDSANPLKATGGHGEGPPYSKFCGSLCASD